jgi:sugar transferase (PEP-CTERM/EpsH1 system associated)
MNVLFLTSRYPFPPVGGDKLVAHHWVRGLSRRHQVTLAALAQTEAETRTAPPPEGPHRTETVVLPRPASYARCLAGLASPLPLQIHYYRSGEFTRLLDRLASETPFDAVVCHLARMAEHAGRFRDLPRVVILSDAIALTYERMRSALGGTGSGGMAGYLARSLSPLPLIYQVERRRIAAWESRLPGEFEASVVHGEADREALVARGAPADRVHVVPIGVDLDEFSWAPPPLDEPRIVFLGNMRTLPNQDAALFFAREVLPRVRRWVPEASFWVIGAEPGPALKRLDGMDGVRVTGAVPDVLPFLRPARVAVAPMRLGAGMQNKVIQTLALGIPSVVSPLALEGIDAKDERHLLVGDDADATAERVVRLLEDDGLCGALSRAGRSLVEERYGWDRVGEAAEAVLLAAVERAG